MFEATELFSRGVGESTDIVRKEMFTLRGRRRALADAAPGGHRAGLPGLRRARHAQAPPAGEALVPVELLPPRARPGRPLPAVLAGGRRGDRLRGSGRSTPSRSSLLERRCWRELGVRELRLRLSSLGSPESRGEYRERLQALPARATRTSLSEEVRSRIELNPLRAFDSDHPGTRRVMRDAPLLLDHLERRGRRAFRARCVRCSTSAGVAYELDPTLVRGLDYYTRTVFEFTSDALGAQSGVGGGGRYDGLVEQLGGPADAGHRLGRRRSSGSCSPARSRAAPWRRVRFELFIALDGSARRSGGRLRAADRGALGGSVRADGPRRPLAQRPARHADGLGARFVAIVDGAETVLRDMQGGGAGASRRTPSYTRCCAGCASSEPAEGRTVPHPPSLQRETQSGVALARVSSSCSNCSSGSSGPG